MSMHTHVSLINVNYSGKPGGGGGGGGGVVIGVQPTHQFVSYSSWPEMR
jgi:hypothetical protein